MHAKQAVILILAGAQAAAGLDPRSPCEFVPRELRLTDVPGILHVVIEKYPKCEMASYRSFGGDALGRRTIEVEVDSGVVTQKNKAWKATAAYAYNHGIRNITTVDQSGYLEYFRDRTTNAVCVRGKMFGESKLVFLLPGFVPPAEDDPRGALLSFYSEALRKFYFIYSDGGGHARDTVASCTLDPEPVCIATRTSLNLLRLSAHGETRVYDSLRLVAFPNGWSHGGYTYYSFDQNALVRSVDALNGHLEAPIEVDSRIGVAYAVEGGREQMIKIRAEKIRGVENIEGIDGMDEGKIKKKVKINRRTLKNFKYT